MTKMNERELAAARSWLAKLTFRNAHNEIITYAESSESHPNNLPIEDIKIAIQVKYIDGLKGFKKDLAMNTIKTDGHGKILH